MKILGLDLSLTETGYCCFSSKEEYYTGVIKTKLRQSSRLVFIRDEIRKIIRNFERLGEEVSLIVIEDYAMGVRGGRSFSIGELGGIIKSDLLEKDYKVILIPPTVLKKFITGSGKAEKSTMSMNLYKKYGIELTNNNEVDACCLSMFGSFYEGSCLGLPGYQKEMLCSEKITVDK